MNLRIEKYHGLGNDFIVVEADSPDGFDAARGAGLCSRHRGIGADGVLLVTPAEEPAARARMIVLNADGSRPEMCGNGLRCVVLHLARATADIPSEFAVETDSGLLACRLTDFSTGAESASVRLELGCAETAGTLVFRDAGKELDFQRISTGNPHAIRFAERESKERIDLLAPQISACVAGGANIEFAVIRADGGIDLDVWERGVGRTQACGTGAAATVVAAALAGHVPFGADVAVNLPGGQLSVQVAEGSLAMILEGPAVHVYSAEVSES